MLGNDNFGFRKAARRLGRLRSELLLERSDCESQAQSLTGPVNPDAPSLPEGEEKERQWKTYLANGRKRAFELGNRGPIRFDADGKLAKEILEAYWRTGFYVFENVLSKQEISDYLQEFEELLDNAPVAINSTNDRHGRPSKYAPYYYLTVPSDPNMFSRTRMATDEQNVTVANIYHPLMVMDAALRLYAHPSLLRVAEAINGPDFVPFRESIFHKGAGVGPATGWHHDGRTHWDPDGNAKLDPWDGNPGMHGFSFHPAFSECNEESCLWVVVGSQFGPWRLHKKHGGQLPDISKEWLPDAAPMLLSPGDVGIHNRNCLHGAYPNKSSERRVTQQMGFHRRHCVLHGGVTQSNYIISRRVHKDPAGNIRRITYDEDFVRKSTRRIALAIDARRQKYPDETPYIYKPLQLEWNEATRAEFKAQDTGEEYWRYDQYM